MAFDAGVVSAVVYELQKKLTGARIDKIHQPEKDEINIILRGTGESFRLVISASANNPRVHLSFINKENPPAPPQYCLMLRKHLANGKILNISQLGFERVIKLEIESKDEMGYPQLRFLYCEIMGKYSNIILTYEDGRIIGAIRPVDFTTSQKRQVLAGMKYELPPSQDKANPLDETPEGFKEKYEGKSVSATDKFIIASYMGLSSLTAREIVYDAKIYNNRLEESFDKVIKIIKNTDYYPVLIKDTSGKPIEYSFFDIKQYENSASVIHYESISAVIEAYFTARDNTDHTRQRASDLFKTIANVQTRLHKKTLLQLTELEDAKKKDEYKLFGDLITAGIYMLKKGMTEAELVDYNDPECKSVRISLDPRLTPAQNAQRYYKKYVKARNATAELQKQLELTRTELEYIDTLLDHLSRAKGQSELDEIRLEAEGSGYLGKLKKGKSKPLPYKLQSKPLEYRTSGGYQVLCGKNNIQNDKLTFKTAEKLDWWFHVKGAPGSHVIMICNGEEPSEFDFTEAAMIAAVNSSLSESKNIAVDYTQVKNIKKPAGANPGFVIYHTNYSAYVEGNTEAVEKLKNKH